MTPVRVLIQSHNGTGWFSRLIKWFSRSTESHTSIRLCYFSPMDDIVHEAWEGVGVRNIEARLYDKQIQQGRIRFFEFVNPLTPSELELAYELTKSDVGNGYDYLGVFKFVTRWRHGADDKWFCSERASWFARSLNRPLFNSTADWEVKPGDIPRSLQLREISAAEALWGGRVS